MSLEYPEINIFFTARFGRANWAFPKQVREGRIRGGKYHPPEAGSISLFGDLTEQEVEVLLDHEYMHHLLDLLISPEASTMFDNFGFERWDLDKMLSQWIEGG